MGANYASKPGHGLQLASATSRDAGDTTYEPGRLAAWTEFHRSIEALPTEDREIFDLLWYQELSQAEAAALLNVSERTIRRRCASGR